MYNSTHTTPHSSERLHFPNSVRPSIPASQFKRLSMPLIVFPCTSPRRFSPRYAPALHVSWSHGLRLVIVGASATFRGWRRWLSLCRRFSLRRHRGCLAVHAFVILSNVVLQTAFKSQQEDDLMANFKIL